LLKVTAKGMKAEEMNVHSILHPHPGVFVKERSYLNRKGQKEAHAESVSY